LNEDRPILSAAKCRPMTIVSGGVRLCEYSQRFAGEERQTTVGLSTTAIFTVFAGYIFGYFRDETIFIIARDSIYAKRAYAIAIPSVRLSVRPSVRPLHG